MYITIKSLWKRHKNKSLITRLISAISAIPGIKARRERPGSLICAFLILA